MLDSIMFTHIPIHPNSMGQFRANVHGHIHNNQPGRFQPVITVDKKTQEMATRPYVNISVEETNYRPLSFEEVRERIRKLGGK